MTCMAEDPLLHGPSAMTNVTGKVSPTVTGPGPKSHLVNGAPEALQEGALAQPGSLGPHLRAYSPEGGSNGGTEQAIATPCRDHKGNVTKRTSGAL